MGGFIIRQVGDAWAVIADESVLAERRSATEAVAAPVERASRAALGGARTVVVLDRTHGRRMMWDSARDSFSKG